MSLLLTTVFIASLVGSLHCVGMCGPFALLAGSSARSRSAAVLPTLAYSFGRLFTYSILGLICGALGLAINQTGSGLHHWQQSATYVAGLLMILIGIIALVRWWGLKVQLPSVAQPLQKTLQYFFQKTLGLQPLPRALVIGMLTSLMPCGWLYTFGITAAGTGSPWWGMVLMLVFWAGTVPIMSALMLGLSGISHRVQTQLPAVMASLVIAMGGFTLAFRAPVDLSSMAEHVKVVQGTGSLIQQVQHVDQIELPCCQGSSKE
jgi:sulfite exporter TauE/SafE